jgi:hypothetical protein
MERARAFCAEASRDNAEPLAATASRVDNWILVEYRGLWGHDALASSGLPDAVKRRLRELRRARPNTKLLFVRRTERRHHRGLAVFWGSSPERGARLYRTEIARYEDLLALDLASPGEPVDHPLLVVCTHGKHDRCCARRRATSGATASPATSSSCPRVSTSDVSARPTPGRSSTTTSRGGSGSSTIAGAAATRSRCRRPSAGSARRPASSASPT